MQLRAFLIILRRILIDLRKQSAKSDAEEQCSRKLPVCFFRFVSEHSLAHSSWVNRAESQTSIVNLLRIQGLEDLEARI